MLHTGVKANRKCVCVSGFGGAAGHEDSSGEETDEDEEDATYQGIPDQVTLKGITQGVFNIYINLGILPLCTELWNDTSCMIKSWYRCQVLVDGCMMYTDIDFEYHTFQLHSI